jgi:hypothetical protein
MRIAAPIALPVIALSLMVPVCRAASSSADEAALDPQAIAQLEDRAATADPREQCFLYTELVHNMAEVASRQIAEGDSTRANLTLKKIEKYAHLIHTGLPKDSKRLKNAEMLMHQTTYRLANFLHGASDEDKPTLQATLKQLDSVHDEILTQVFSH